MNKISRGLLYVSPVLILVYYPVFLLLFIGSLPSLFWIIVHQEKDPYQTICVCAGNICGVSAVLFNLIEQGAEFEALLEMLCEVLVWLILYGPAVFGLFIYFFLSKAFIGSIKRRGQKIIKKCEDLKAALIEEWGTEVAKSSASSIKGE